jgi:fumarate hydratase class II
MSQAGTRIEIDSLGDVAAPADKLWGTQTIARSSTSALAFTYVQLLFEVLSRLQ